MTAIDVPELVSVITNTLSTNYENRLKRLLNDALDDFAGEMLEKGLISRTLARDPSYSKIMDQFISFMGLMSEQSEVEEHCTSFIRVLHCMGGPIAKAGELIKKQLIKEVQEKLKVTLSIDS